MTAAAGAAVAAATRIYTDELDRIIDRHFPGHSVKASAELMPWDDGYRRDYWPLVSAVPADLREPVESVWRAEA